mmetsp:Transcript_14957/g.27789  ORF Transcript_14957/g.27789 Transcript_14957/m.27789 type:complete len:129 (+) Transcript_14957:1509-1895(+)
MTTQQAWQNELTARTGIVLAPKNATRLQADVRVMLRPASSIAKTKLLLFAPLGFLFAKCWNALSTKNISSTPRPKARNGRMEFVVTEVGMLNAAIQLLDTLCVKKTNMSPRREQAGKKIIELAMTNIE